MKFKKQLILAIILLGVFTAMTAAVAGPISTSVQNVGNAIYGGAPRPPQELIGLLIKSALTFIGIIFIALMVYGGFLYMTGGGKEDKVKKAKDIIIAAVIGLVIVFSAYAIATFVLNAITSSSGAGYGGVQPGLQTTK